MVPLREFENLLRRLLALRETVERIDGARTSTSA
jgi:hypothetical protein